MDYSQIMLENMISRFTPTYYRAPTAGGLLSLKYKGGKRNAKTLINRLKMIISSVTFHSNYYGNNIQFGGGRIIHVFERSLTKVEFVFLNNIQLKQKFAYKKIQNLLNFNYFTKRDPTKCMLLFI